MLLSGNSNLHIPHWKSSLFYTIHFFVTVNKLDHSWKTYLGQLIYWLPRMSQSANSLSLMSLNNNNKKHGNRFQSSMPLNSNILSHSPRKLNGALVSIICIIRLWLGFPNINFLLKYEGWIFKPHMPFLSITKESDIHVPSGVDMLP